MKLGTRILFPIVVLTSFLIVSPGYGQQNKFKLKPEARGNLCLECHDQFKEKLKNQFIHTPVKDGDCSGCHNPHSSSHGKLLFDDPNRICSKCHEGIVPDKAKSTHKVVLEGNCVKCHDPHASNSKGNLIKAGNELCATCHKAVTDVASKVKFKHSPVVDGCINCHAPHGSAKAEHLLKNDLVSLCGECHKMDNPVFAKQHMNYPVAKANCSSCHDPHGSNKPGILFENVHVTLANKLCTQCHEAATSPNPFKTKRTGYELCQGCHSNMVNDTLSKNQIHWPLLDKKGCLHCHRPHASAQKNLLNENIPGLCGTCHADTMERQKKLAEIEKQEESGSKVKEARGAFTHNPVKEGNCGACHAYHSADNRLLIKQPSNIELCGTCHDWQKHSSHPLGPKVRDSRNKNMTMDCLTCHRSHGTGYRWMLTFKTSSDLCVQCHKKMKK